MATAGYLKHWSSFFKRKPEPTYAHQSLESSSSSDGFVESSNSLIEVSSNLMYTLMVRCVFTLQPSVGHQLDEYSINDEHSINDPPLKMRLVQLL